MDAPRWKSVEVRSDVCPEDSIRACYVQIAKVCLWAGLSPADAEDLAQDVWEWMVRAGVPIGLVATPWLKRVVQNYILRFRRRRQRLGLREGLPLEKAPEPITPPSDGLLESKELLDRVASMLPKRERNLLALIRRGYSIAEASNRLGIPPGSRAYYQGQLIAYARREMQRRNQFPTTGRPSRQRRSRPSAHAAH
jgi:DNA-directed RNA polymerase specialized sigma24 family protein